MTFSAITHFLFNMKITACKIENSCVESIIHIIDITGQLISKLAVKSNLAATDLQEICDTHP